MTCSCDAYLLLSNIRFFIFPFVSILSTIHKVFVLLIGTFSCFVLTGLLHRRRSKLTSRKEVFDFVQLCACLSLCCSAVTAATAVCCCLLWCLFPAISIYAAASSSSGSSSRAVQPSLYLLCTISRKFPSSSLPSAAAGIIMIPHEHDCAE